MTLLVLLLACAPSTDDTAAWNDACAGYLIEATSCFGPTQPIDVGWCGTMSVDLLTCATDALADGCDADAVNACH